MMESRLESVGGQFFAQLSVNPRLRIGIALIACILGVYLILNKSEDVQKKLQNYRRISARLERTRLQATDTAWLQRGKAASDMLAEMREHDWTASNNGLIQSKWNDTLQTILTTEKVTNSSITISESLNGSSEGEAKAEPGSANGLPSELSVVKAKLHFEAQPKTLYNFLQVVDANKQSMIVETFSYQWLNQTGRVEVNLKALTRAVATTGGGEAPSVATNASKKGGA